MFTACFKFWMIREGARVSLKNDELVNSAPQTIGQPREVHLPLHLSVYSLSIRTVPSADTERSLSGKGISEVESRKSRRSGDRDAPRVSIVLSAGPRLSSARRQEACRPCV